MSESNGQMTNEQKIDKILTLSVNTNEDVKDIKSRMSGLEKTVNSHTTSLDKLLTTKKSKADESVISVDRFDRLEHWAQLVGQKLGIELKL